MTDKPTDDAPAPVAEPATPAARLAKGDAVTGGSWVRQRDGSLKREGK